MQSVTEHIRQHLLNSLGFWHHTRRLPSLESLLQTEWCHEFERARRYRMIMGAFRYGLLNDPAKWEYNLLGGLSKKLQQYDATGNTEALVDAANYLMLEFMRPSHPKAHYRAEDDYNHCPTK